MRPRSKRVPLTGCASGIGRSIRELFAEEGASIAMRDVDTGGGRETLEIVKAPGAQGSFVRADVSRSPPVLARAALSMRTLSNGSSSAGAGYRPVSYVGRAGLSP